MTRVLITAIGVIAAGLVAASLATAHGGGIQCGGNTATDRAGNTAKFHVKTYDVGCNRADKGVKRYYRQTNGERGTRLRIRGYICGPLQDYKGSGSFAFQCRSTKGASKRYKAHWVTNG